MEQSIEAMSYLHQGVGLDIERRMEWRGVCIAYDNLALTGWHLDFVQRWRDADFFSIDIHFSPWPDV